MSQWLLADMHGNPVFAIKVDSEYFHNWENGAFASPSAVNDCRIQPMNLLLILIGCFKGQILCFHNQTLRTKVESNHCFQLLSVLAPTREPSLTLMKIPTHCGI